MLAVEPLEVALLLVGVAQVQVEWPQAQQLSKVPGYVDVVQIELWNLYEVNCVAISCFATAVPFSERQSQLHKVIQQCNIVKL